MKEQMKNALALYNDDQPLDLPTAADAALYRPYVGMTSDSQENESVHLRDYWYSVRKRIWLVIGITALVTTLVMIYMLRKPDVYEARARVRVDLESNNPLFGAFKNSSVVVNNSTTDPAYFNTQLQILSDEGLLRRTVKALDLEHNPTFMKSKNNLTAWQRLEASIGFGPKQQDGSKVALIQQSASATPAQVQITAETRNDIEEATRLAPMIEHMQNLLKVEPVKETRLPVKETRLIDIRFDHTDARLAASVVNSIADSFVYQNLEKKTETNASAGDFLQKRIAELQTQIRSGEEKLIGYAKSNQILSLDASQNTVVERLAGLNRQLLEAENDRKLAEATYHAALSPNAAGAASEENAKYLVDMEQKLVDLRQKREQLLVDNTEEWPEVQEVTRQIGSLEKQIRDARGHAASVYVINLETKYKQSLQREESLRTAFNTQRGETLTQNEAAINYRIIQQEIETNKSLLDGLLQKSKENDVMVAGTPNNISVVNYSIVPQQPVGPKRLLYVLLSMGVALGFSLCLAVFLEYLDNTVRSTDDVERMLHLPALAVIPSVGGMANKRWLPFSKKVSRRQVSGADRPELLFNAEPHSSVAEAYKQLRTSVLLSTAGRAPKRLLITSGQPREGKTTTSVNTSYSLAQTGAKVLIIDADMRRPTVHTVFDMANHQGLSTILSREMSAAEILALVQVHERSGVHVLPSGTVPPNPAELLGSNQMRRMLDVLEEHFDHIIIDSPPVASITDGVLISSMVDGVILVVHGGHSTRDLVRRAKQLMQGVGARVFGVVLNNVNLHQHDYYYYGYYGKPYGALPEASH